MQSLNQLHISFILTKCVLDFNPSLLSGRGGQTARMEPKIHAWNECKRETLL